MKLINDFSAEGIRYVNQVYWDEGIAYWTHGLGDVLMLGFNQGGEPDPDEPGFGVGTPEPGDLVVLIQRSCFTHIVRVMSDEIITKLVEGDPHQAHRVTKVVAVLGGLSAAASLESEQNIERVRAAMNNVETRFGVRGRACWRIETLIHPDSTRTLENVRNLKRAIYALF